MAACIQKFSIFVHFIEKYIWYLETQGRLAESTIWHYNRHKDYVHISEASRQQVEANLLVSFMQAHDMMTAKKCASGLWGVAAHNNGNMFACYTKKGQVVICWFIITNNMYIIKTLTTHCIVNHFSVRVLLHCFDIW